VTAEQQRVHPGGIFKPDGNRQQQPVIERQWHVGVVGRNEKRDLAVRIDHERGLVRTDVRALDGLVCYTGPLG